MNGSSLVCDAGTLQGFAFDSDEELERPAVEKAGSPEQMKHEEGGDDGKETKKKKVPAKAPVCAAIHLLWFYVFMSKEKCKRCEQA